MKVTDITARPFAVPQQFKGRIQGTDLIIEKGSRDDPWLTLRVELSKGELGLIKFKTRNEGSPADELLELVAGGDLIETMDSAVAAMEKVLRLASQRPVSQRDMVRLEEPLAKLREWSESLRANVDQLTGTQEVAS